MRLTTLIMPFLLAAFLSLSAGSSADLASNQSANYAVQATSESVNGNAIDGSRADLVSFLKEARNYTLANGRAEAFRAFSDPEGEFVRGDMYVFAYDFNGTLLAHPYLLGRIGMNNLDFVDQNGVPIIENMVDVARLGEGFTYFVYPNPNRGNQIALKLIHVIRVDEGLWIGSGIYLPGQVPLFSLEDRRGLKNFVDRARDYALVRGREAALAAFNDPEGGFVKREMYVFAFDFQGNTLSLPIQRDLLGTNRLDSRDSSGVTFTRNNLEHARIGSGLAYYIYPDPGKNMSERLKLSYVTRVDDGWWLGSGIYASTSSAWNASAMRPADREELKTFVDEARSHAIFVGKDRALKEFMDMNGTWVREDVYVFAQKFDGTSLCLPHMPEAVGTNRLDIQNDLGIYINREMRAIAMNGSGFYEYSWRKPMSNQSEPKVSYVSRVDDSWWLGAGIYDA